MIPVERFSLLPFPSAADLVGGLDHLPSGPKVIPRLLNLLQDGNSSIFEIASMIRLDAGIATKVLRLANSVYFGKGQRIVSIDEAVIRIGYAQIAELVALASTAGLLDQPLFAYHLTGDRLWSLSVSCAFAAELLAEQCGEDVNVAYTLGLLHNVGMVVVNEYALQGRHPRLIDTGFPREWVDSERLFLGYSQEELGAELLHAWDFPSFMSTPVRFQYQPLGSVGNKRMACLLHAAKWIRSQVCAEGSLPPALAPAVLALLRMDKPKLMKIASDVRLRLLEARHLLESQHCVA